MISFSAGISSFALSIICTLVVGCVKAPAIAVVDNRTALEIQAAGEYPELEFQSTDKVLEPKPSAVSGEDIVSKGGTSFAGPNLELFTVSQSDAQFIDTMLLKGCLGEGDDGLLKYTPDRCDERVQVSEVLRVASRNNLHRRQVWEYLASQGGSASTLGARHAWRSVHLEQVRCGAWIEEDGVWAQKTC